ncbi:hypothetical protein MN116_008596 [Schistosoma mekongi]|uniref:Alpha-tubulin N-acetyltransferase n=1 Tax=Schistosoma mekongi TaxID=38744 RepID=A0AAE1Z4W1_SCHME|nr:hypothetical protein MN116_008596 [Schistosoma mekongi]
MDFGAGLENVLQQEVTVIYGGEAKKSCFARNNQLNVKDVDIFKSLAVLLDFLGELSAKAQKLPRPVTSFIKFRNSDQAIFLLSDIPVKRVLGFLKVGRKRLFVHDRKGVCVECIPLCVLDFYIHDLHQRKGYGKKLFDFMLKTENIHPSYLAIDLPSMKMIQFLHKHYNLINPIYLPNNFVIYSEFFNNLNNSNYSIIQSKLTTIHLLKCNNRIHQNKINHSIINHNIISKYTQHNNNNNNQLSNEQMKLCNHIHCNNNNNNNNNNETINELSKQLTISNESNHSNTVINNENNNLKQTINEIKCINNEQLKNCKTIQNQNDNKSVIVTNSNDSIKNNFEMLNYRSSELQNRSRTSYSYINAVRNHNCHTRLW